MYSKLYVDVMESEDVASEHGDPKSEIATSGAQCTGFWGVAAIVSDAKLVVVVVVVVDVELHT
jgi:hypothetical protein